MTQNPGAFAAIDHARAHAGAAARGLPRRLGAVEGARPGSILPDLAVAMIEDFLGG